MSDKKKQFYFTEKENLISALVIRSFYMFIADAPTGLLPQSRFGEANRFSCYTRPNSTLIQLENARRPVLFPSEEEKMRPSISREWSIRACVSWMAVSCVTGTMMKCVFEEMIETAGRQRFEGAAPSVCSQFGPY